MYRHQVYTSLRRIHDKYLTLGLSPPLLTRQDPGDPTDIENTYFIQFESGISLEHETYRCHSGKLWLKVLKR